MPTATQPTAPAPATARPSRAELRIAYVVGRYPAVSHAFILREVAALRRRGVEVRPISIHRPRPGDLLSQADREEAERTRSVLPARPWALLSALIVALALRPAGCLRAARGAMRMARPGLRGRVWAMFYVLEGLVIWRFCRRDGIRHLHVHHLNQASDATMAAVAVEGHDADGRPRWSWSFTMHGPDELFDLSAFSVAEKARAASFVACISDFARSQLMALLDPHEWAKLRVVHCGADLVRYVPPEARGRRPGAPLEVLCVARLTPVKGHHVLLDAVELLAERDVPVRVTIIGDGPRRAPLEEDVRRRGLQESVYLAGAVGQDQLADHYRASDVFVLPSFAEGVPVVLMEAMATELPVVATRVGGIAELVEDEVGGLLLPPGRGDLLADALERLAAEPELRDRLGQAGRRRVVESFDADHEAGLLHAALVEAAGR
jgi:glycosyltransferase involved in cell wall biosynthesis